MVTEDVVENWKAAIAQVVQGYEDHRGVVHGLQKDAIQNGWGNRLYTKGKDWKFVFELIPWQKNEYLLTMTDIGGYGLTGQNMCTEEIPDELSEDERLARFEHMHFSGGATKGAGMYGRGKLLFTAASKDHHIIYDSLTHKGEYRLNQRKLIGRKLLNFKKALEEDEAKRTIIELTKDCLNPLESSGTRITIVNPRDDIVEAIYNNTFLRFIEETWWQILQKHVDTKIYVKTKKETQHAEIPKEFKDLPESDDGKWKAKLFPIRFDYDGRSFKIKKAHFIVSPYPVPPETRGVYLYRREMKVGDLTIGEIPDEIIDRFYGYVELETESELEKIYLEERTEDLEHYSINKNKGLGRKLKHVIQSEFNKFKNEKGYGVSSTRILEERTRRILEEALEELNRRMARLGITVGTSKASKDIKVSLEDIKLPSEGSVVNIGDQIKNIKFKIENSSDRQYYVYVSVATIESNGKQIESLFEQKFDLEGQGYKIAGPFSFTIQEAKYPAKGEILLSCVVKDSSSGKTLGTKNIHLFISERPSQISFPIQIELEKITFPKGLDNKRVNFGEAIKNIVYTVTNNTSEKIKVRLNVRILYSETKEEIEPIYKEDIFLEPFKDKKIKCPDVNVTKEKYGILDRERGIVILRALVSVLDDSETRVVKKGDKVKLDIRFWVNMDSGKGIFESFEGWDGGSNEPKSKVVFEGEIYKFRLNTKHPAFEDIQKLKEEEYQFKYTYEQLLRQTLNLLLMNDKLEDWPDVEGKPYKKIIKNDKADKQEIIESVLNTLDYLYAEYLTLK
jgi:hypothetical protein